MNRGSAQFSGIWTGFLWPAWTSCWSSIAHKHKYVGSRHEVSLVHLAEVLKIRFFRSLAYRLQDLLLFHPSQVGFPGRRPPVRHIEVERFCRLIGGDKARRRAHVVGESDRVNRLADAKRQKFNHNGRDVSSVAVGAATGPHESQMLPPGPRSSDGREVALRSPEQTRSPARYASANGERKQNEPCVAIAPTRSPLVSRCALLLESIALQSIDMVPTARAVLSAPGPIVCSSFSSNSL